MNTQTKPQLTSWKRWRNSWRLTSSILYMLNSRSELGRLEAWAKRKRLSGPQKAYASKQQHINHKLLTLRIRLPRQYHQAYCLHLVSKLVSPTPRPVKGAGSHYRKNRRVRN